jgi:hypothetical protein
METETMPQTSKSADLDQTNFEDVVSAAIARRLGGMPPDIYESNTLGVVAIGRLEGQDSARVDWQEVAAELARETGVGVVCIANCDWTFDDRHDEEATFISFDLPSVTGSYRNDPYRNHISPVDPAAAPAQADFDNLKRARGIVKNHLGELRARRETLISAKKDERPVLDRIEEIERLKDLEAGDRDAVKAVLDLDFDAAVLIVAAEPASPRM